MTASPRPVRFLVIGVARSGTTLLQRLACELRDVWVPHETHFWSVALRELTPPGGRLAVTDANRLIATLAETSRDEVVQRAASSVTNSASDRAPGLWPAFEALVSEMAPRERDVLGEKTPGHVIAAPLLAHVHPELKIVAVVRDPRAVLVSHREVDWGIRDPEVLAWRWRLRMTSIDDLAQALGPERVLVATYESVVDDPTAARARLARFLHVPDQSVPVSATPATLFSPREVWRQRALHDADLTRVDRWRDHLAASDERQVLTIAGPVMERFGYDTSRQVPTSAMTPGPGSLTGEGPTVQGAGAVALREQRACARPFAYVDGFFR